MIIFLDTSVVLRILFREPEPVAGWGKWTGAYASRLWHTEALRVVDRMRLSGALDDPQVVHLRREIDRIHRTFHIVSFSERILVRASDAFPTALGTLDAIHLATALSVRDSVTIDAFLTHDGQLAAAAAAMGFEVQG